MVTHVKYNIPVFWDNEFKKLDYIYEPFNDPESVAKWVAQGYSEKIAGAMCDMRSAQPTWNNKFIDIYTEMGWKDIGTSYYRMDTGTVMPTHSDLFVKYINLFDLKGKEQRIRRAVVYLEDWKPGHYSEINGVGMVNWPAGTVLEWQYDTPHAASNIGLEPRYTLQITGWV
jgi:hypothetical protein